MATKSKQKSESEVYGLTRLEFRRAVREYAAPLLGEMLRKQQISTKLPDEPLRRTIAIGCIRWAIEAVKQEGKYCLMEEDATEREALQRENEEEEATLG